MKKFVLGVAALAITAGGASAADMAVKAPPPPVVQPTCVWCGFYIGLNAGGSWDKSAANYTFFGSVPPTGYTRKELPGRPAIPSAKRLTIDRPERQAYLGLAWGAPALGDSEMYAVEILAHILGGSHTSRLNQALRERAKLVSTITAGYEQLFGNFGISGGLMTRFTYWQLPGNTKDALWTLEGHAYGQVALHVSRVAVHDAA